MTFVRPTRVLACTAAIASFLAVAHPIRAATLAPYRGLGTWVDIYDAEVWADPEAAVAAIESRGVGTVYLETANYRQRHAIVRPKRVGRFLEAAHAAGIRVVAWYLPGFVEPATDVARSLAAIHFRSASGQRFDGFALDIESTAVPSPTRRTARLLHVGEELRSAVGPRYRLGAIIPSPRGLELSPGVWPRFPYAGLAERFDVFLPMVYFTYRTTGRSETRAYVAESIAVLRRETGDPALRIHVIGGIADRATVAEVRGFADAVCADRLLGASLYDFATTARRHWPTLARLARCVSGESPTPAQRTAARRRPHSLTSSALSTPFLLRSAATPLRESRVAMPCMCVGHRRRGLPSRRGLRSPGRQGRRRRGL